MMKISRSINQFFHWWGRELAFLVPEKIRRIFNENHGELIILSEGEHLTLLFNINSQSKVVGRYQLRELDGTEYMELCNQDERIKKSNIILRLSSRDALKRELFLPQAVDENLDQVIAYELDKYTPFTVEQVYFAVKRLGKDDATGLLKVLLILTTREKLEAVYRELRKFDLTPVLADYEDEPNDFEKDYEFYNLLPEWARLKQSNISGLINFSLSGLLAALLCVAFILPVWLDSRAVDSLKKKMAQAGGEARVVENLRAETEQAHEVTNRLISKKKSAASLLGMVDILSRLIGDDTWITHLQFNNEKLQVQGQSPSASSLIGVLESSPKFSSVRFVSPVTQDRRSGLERFQISAVVNNSGE